MNREPYDLNELRMALADVVRSFESPAACSRDMGISRSHLSRLLSGKVKPGKKVLDWLGLKSVVIYVDISDQSE